MLNVSHYLVMLHRSYDTGEEDRTKGALMQENSYSYEQAQSKVPTKIANLAEPQFCPSYSDIFFSLEFCRSFIGLYNNLVV